MLSQTVYLHVNIELSYGYQYFNHGYTLCIKLLVLGKIGDSPQLRPILPGFPVRLCTITERTNNATVSLDYFDLGSNEVKSQGRCSHNDWTFLRVIGPMELDYGDLWPDTRLAQGMVLLQSLVSIRNSLGKGVVAVI